MKHDKQSLRTHIQSLTKKIPLEERKIRAVKLWERVEARDDFWSAQTVLLYRSLDDEIDTYDFIRKRQKHKTIVLPCVEDDHLILRCFDGEENMILGQQFSLVESQGEIISPSMIDLACIPGVAFDQDGYRLGRGGGYYDRLIPHLTCSKIGICYERQMIDSVPREEHDRGVDEVLVA